MVMQVVEVEPAATTLELLVLAADRQRQPGEPQAPVGRREQRAASSQSSAG